MKQNSSLISIIVAVLNSATTLDRCLKSIIDQSYSNNEIIVIDGGSTDDSLSIINSHRAHLTYWESGLDHGIYHAWNKGLKHAQGEWVCFLGADDYFWDKNVLRNLQHYLIFAIESDIRIVHGRIARVDKNDKLIEFWGKPWEKNRWQMPHGMPLGMPHTGLMHHKKLFAEHGLFDDSLQFAGDYEFLLRELKDKKRSPLFVSEIVIVGQQVGGAADSNAFKFHQEVAIARQKNGLPKFSWVWWLVHLRTLFRETLKKYILKSRVQRNDK